MSTPAISEHAGPDPPPGGTDSSSAQMDLLAWVPRVAARRSSCPIIVVRGRATQPLRRVVEANCSPILAP